MELTLSLATDSDKPVYQKVADAIKEEILSGRLKAGGKLPSTRDLANSLDLSRHTVIRAYEELSAQGYIETVAGSGVFVKQEFAASINTPPSSQSKAVREPRLSSFGKRIKSVTEENDAEAELFSELNFGAPALDQLPLTRWRDMLYRSTRFDDPSMLTHEADPFGYRPLREALAGYLGRARSVRCSYEQIAIFSGARSALDLIGRMLVEPGDIVAVENPGFAGAHRFCSMFEATMRPVEVDDDGLRIDRLITVANAARLVYVTPSHQDPTGVVMSLPRRLALLNWASRMDAWIIEDDYDSEFSYATKPTPSLQGLDKDDRVIYMSTFWKILYPVLRLGFLVLPTSLVDSFRGMKALIERDLPILEQRALTNFIEEGHLERHIKRTRSLYFAKRAVLLQALAKQFKTKVKISKVSAGMHVVLQFPKELDGKFILQSARNAGASLVSTLNHYIVDAKENEFLMGFAHLDDEQIITSIEKFRQNLEL